MAKGLNIEADEQNEYRGINPRGDTVSGLSTAGILDGTVSRDWRLASSLNGDFKTDLPRLHERSCH